VVLHFDRPYYQPGQIIFYSCSIDGIVEDDVTLHLSLTGESGVLASHFVELLSGVAHGYFQLPFDCDAGIYSFTSDLFDLDAGKPVAVAQVPIYIVRAPDVLESLVSELDSSRCSLSPNINIELPPHTVNREVIKCRIKVDDGRKGDLLSVSVRDAELFPNGQTTYVSTRVSKYGKLANAIPIVADRILPNAQRTESNIVFASLPEQLTFRFGLLDDDSRFQVLLPTFYGTKNLVFIDNASPDSEVKIVNVFQEDRSHIGWDAKGMMAIKDVPTNNMRRKIYELYGQLEETVAPIKLPSATELVAPDYQIDVQDFAVRGRFVDLLKELFSPFYFRKKNDGTYFLKVLYEVLGLKEYYEDEAVIYINGVGTRDFDYVANLPLQDIKTVHMYAALKTLRSLKLVDVGGVGVIEMVDPLFVIPEDKRLASSEVQGLQVPVQFPIVADSKSVSPQLKALLFWHPDLRLDENGECLFEIVASDDVSTFDVEAVHHRSKTVQRTQLSISYQVLRD